MFFFFFYTPPWHESNGTYNSSAVELFHFIKTPSDVSTSNHPYEKHN